MDFNKNKIFTHFEKILKCKLFLKIRPLGYEMFHANGENDG